VKTLRLTRRTTGQTFLWFLAAIAASCMMLLVVYNVGQVSNAKEKTTNAADSVAMSGGLVQARGMNLMAYTNRAMIANEVTIAQLASVDTWVKFNYQFAANLNTVGQFIPIIGDFTTALQDVMEAIYDVVNEGVGFLIPIFDDIVQALDVQRYAILIATPLAANDAANEAANENSVQMNGNLAFSTLAALDNWNKYWNPSMPNSLLVDHSKNSGQNGQDDRSDAQQIISNSRDQFSSDREAGKMIDWMNRLAAFSPLTIQLNKSSGSAELVDPDHWEVQDSMEQSLALCYIVGCTSLVSGPLAWARANVNNDNSNGNDWVSEGRCKNGASWFSACYFAWWADYPSGPDQFSGFSGVPEMFDVQDQKRQNAALYYFVSVTKSASTTSTAQNLGIDNPASDPGSALGSPRLTDALNNNELPAISSARIFFFRPKRDPNADPTAITAQNLTREDNVKEYASLYNPYWQTRLHTPNCKLLSNPGSDDCNWRMLLYTGSGQLPAQLVIDAMP